MAAEEVWQMAPFTAPPEALLKAEFKSKVAEGTKDIVLAEEWTYSVDAAGRRTTHLHRIYKVLTEAGVHGWDSTERRWESWHEYRPVFRARVITADGAVHELDKKTIAEMPVDEENDTYSDARHVKAPLPAVAAGAVVEEEVTSTDKVPVMGGKMARRFFFGMGVPVEHAAMTIEVPAGTPLRYTAHLLPNLETKRTEENGKIRVVFTQGPMAPVEESEEYMPFDAERWPNVVFSTTGSWAEIAASYNHLVEAQLNGAVVDGLLTKPAGKKLSKLELASALLEKLHDNVRYTGIEFGEASFVPRTPAELAKRKFGDCKDQAALLVAMLRAAGIPAEVALLNSGTGQDLDPEFPGWGEFDHAIVHVPGEPEMWADPTSVFSRFNELPLGDRNRWALLVNATGKLVKTPEARSEENRNVETREFLLAEKGKARITETTRLSGSLEVYLRNDYDSADPKRTQKVLDTYVKDAYLSEKPARYEFSKPRDLSRNFELRIEATDGARGSSGDNDAVVAVAVGWMPNRLPEVLRTEVDEKHPKRKGDLVLPEPQVVEWNYRIVPPPGFRPVPLPDGGDVKLGPATIQKKFQALPDGTIEARIRFDMGKRVYSATDVEETRAAVVRLQATPMTLVRYERIAQALLKADKVREALDELNRLITLHPKEALHHTQMAQALLQVGIAEAAREEAQRATKLEPDNAAAHAALGWILEHDLVGRRFQKGCDLEGAERAYRRALEIDGTDVDTRVSLAIMLESSPDGERYASREKLKQAIAEYRKLDGKLTGSLENNMLFALLRAEEFDEVRAEADKKHNPTSEMLLLAAIAAKDGAAAAVAEAKKRISNDGAQRTALNSAGQQLIVLRRYKDAARLIEASAEGSDKAEAERARAQVLAKAERYEDFIKHAEGPTKVVYKLFGTFGDWRNGLERAQKLLTADSPGRSEEQKKKAVHTLASLRTQASTIGITQQTLADLSVSGAQMRVEGDDGSMYRIRTELLSPNGATKFTAYVVRENGAYELLDTDDVPALGARALHALERGDKVAARRMLDWAREKEQLVGGEDPLAGWAFPRFWTKGADPDAAVIQYAAASLMARTKDAVKAVEILQKGQREAASDGDRLKFQLALCEAYLEMEKHDQSAAVAKELMRQYPLSERALATAVGALSVLRQWGEAERLIADRLKATPEDRSVQRVAGGEALAKADFERVIEMEKKVVASGEANEEDLNALAWASLCGGHVTPETIETAQNSVKMGKAQQFGALHTLAAVYAEAGKTTEAREVMLHGMEVGAQTEPDGSSWYVFGRIAEQYGLRESALADYRRVEKPKNEYQIGGSSWTLVQKRIAELSRRN